MSMRRRVMGASRTDSGFSRAREWLEEALRTLVSTRAVLKAMVRRDPLQPFEPLSINALENPA
jgi:hypothetical protein